jgi:manganese/zinc/iron transport system permease protein
LLLLTLLSLAALTLAGLGIAPMAAVAFVTRGLAESYVARTVTAGAIVLGVTGGVLGTFAVTRGQSLLGDAVSHSALPGIFILFMAYTLADLGGREILGFTLPEPRSLTVVLAGALVTGLLATAVVLWAARGTRLHQDAALAVTLSTFFGFGIVLRSFLQARPTAFGNRAGLESFLYGSAATLTRSDVQVLLGLTVISLLIVFALWKELQLLAFDPDYLATLGRPRRALDAVITVLIVIAVIVGLPMVGVILMSAMLVAPAVAARQWSDRLSRVVLIATVIGVAGGLVGAVASGSRAQVATGPVIALYVSAVAVASVLVAPGRGVLWRWARRRRQRGRFAVDTLLLHLRHQPSATPASGLAAALGWPERVLANHLEQARRNGWIRADRSATDTQGWALSEAGHEHVEEVLRGLGDREEPADKDELADPVLRAARPSAVEAGPDGGGGGGGAGPRTGRAATSPGAGVESGGATNDPVTPAAPNAEAATAPRGRRRWLRLAPAFAFVLLGIGWTLANEPRALFGDVLVMLLITAAACSIVGCWLVLRRMAMMADAIAHAILFGIVIMFFFVNDPSSPLFLVGAAMAGLLTVAMTEALLGTGLVREDAAIGMTFPLLFALALVIIALAFRDAHVDEHLVLAGGVEITVLQRLVIEGWTLPGWLSASIGGLLQSIAPAEAVRVTRDGVMTIDGWSLGPRSVWTMGGLLLLNLTFVGWLWKELELATFDAGLAASLGFAPVLLNYGLMGLVSLTAVGSFEAVGSILVIALFVGPTATAYLLTDDLREMAAGAVLLALVAAWLGFLLGRAWGVNFGGAVATVTGLLFLAALLLAPDQGLLTRAWRRRRQRLSFAEDMLLVHLHHHAGTAVEAEESSLQALPEHLRWSAKHTKRIADRLADESSLRVEQGRLILTASGAARAREVLARD